VSLGPWAAKETTLRSGRGPALCISGPGAHSAMVRNLRLVAAPNAAAVEIHTVPGSKKWGYSIMGIGWDKT